MTTGTSSLIVNERDGRIAILQQDQTTGWLRREIALHGRWPAFSPDGARVVHSTIVPSGDTGRSIIATVAADGGTPGVIHEGAPGMLAFIAPTVPHYSLWAPTGDAVSYVSVTEQGLSLFLTTLDGTVRSHRVAAGVPLFHAWSSDGQRIALHSGTDVAIFERTNMALTEIARGSYGFRVPRFLPGAETLLLYGMPAGEGVSLVVKAVDGPARAVSQFAGGLAFSCVDNARVLVAVSRARDGSIFEELWLVDLHAGDRQPVAPGAFAAFWVAPTGDRVALLVPAHSGDGRIALQVRDFDGHVLATTEPFLLSDDARIAVSFFDQYELSHPVWAPDGSGLVLSGRLGDDAVSASWGDAVGDYVLYWAARRGAPLERVTPGVCASFPRANHRGAQ